MTRATGATPGNDARSDWATRVSRRSDESGRRGTPDLAPPAGLNAEPGVGHVRLSWSPVDGAVGYLVHRAPAGQDAFAPVDHLGGDVLAVPDPWYVDTTGEPGRSYAYAVACVPEVTVVGPLSAPVAAAARPATGAPPTVRLRVDAAAPGGPLHRPWQPMIGSERPSQLLCRDRSGGREIGAELLAALRRVRVETVRAHETGAGPARGEPHRAGDKPAVLDHRRRRTFIAGLEMLSIDELIDSYKCRTNCLR